MSTLIDRLPPHEQAAIRNAGRGELVALCRLLDLNPDSVRGALSRERRSETESEPRVCLGDDPIYNSLADLVAAIKAEGENDADRLIVAAAMRLPKATKPRFDGCPKPTVIVEEPKPLHLDRWLYAADQHAPFHDDLWIERLCRVAYHEEIENLIIGGDFFDLDSVSDHPGDLPQSDLNESIETAGQVLRWIKSHVKTIYILAGNHDRRLARRLDKNLSFRNLVRMAVGDMAGIVTTEQDYFLVNDSTPEQPGWTVGHPRFFASYPTRGLDQVALHRQRHVIGAHSHTLGATKIGPYWCVSPGMMMRADLTPYLARSHKLSKYADQSCGFVLVERVESEGDLVRLFADGMVRWSDYK